VLFIADNLATLEYKLQEEVMTVIQALGSVVSTCTPLVSVLEKARVEGAPTDSIEGKRVIMDDVSGKSTPELALIFLFRPTATATGARPISSSTPVS
jgi:cohesin loading factor subunit SCC2